MVAHAAHGDEVLFIEDISVLFGLSRGFRHTQLQTIPDKSPFFGYSERLVNLFLLPLLDGNDLSLVLIMSLRFFFLCPT